MHCESHSRAASLGLSFVCLPLRVQFCRANRLRCGPVRLESQNTSRDACCLIGSLLIAGARGAGLQSVFNQFNWYEKVALMRGLRDGLSIGASPTAFATERSRL